MFALSPSGRVATVSPAGDLDVAVERALRQAMQHALDSRAPLVVLDMRSVAFCGSTGVNLMVWADRRLTVVGGRLLTVNVPPAFAKVLSTLDLLDRLDVWAFDRPLRPAHMSTGAQEDQRQPLGRPDPGSSGARHERSAASRAPAVAPAHSRNERPALD